jgi:hypothetical protein
MSAGAGTADAVGHARPAPMPKDVPKTGREAVRVFFAHLSPRALSAMIVIAVAARVAVGGWSGWDAVVVAAVIAYWPLNEWLIHVYMLHYRPVTLFGRRLDFLLPRTHREHHANPWHLPRVFIPKHIYPTTLPLFVLIVLLAPDQGLALSFVSIYLLLGLHYEWCHFLAHIGWCPRIAYYQRRVREHRLHHFRNENYWWGVSMGLGDRLLGTAPDPASVDRSSTTGKPVDG